MDDIHIDGLVHISDLGEDYFNFRPEIMAIEGERSGIRFNMGTGLPSGSRVPIWMMEKSTLS
ncbi:ribonuclease [Neisseria gonorrhoeae]|uniref:Ribonuclease n=1 Tax=Neisseria gonorrhoeae TaxID=485 RepID=A0A378VWD3_NEIGO|nr:ribonuclease [Neisseria gonorrhoeae]